MVIVCNLFLVSYYFTSYSLQLFQKLAIVELMDFKGISDPVVLTVDNLKKPGFFSKIRPPSTNFFKNKKALGGLLTVLLLFAVGIGVYLSQKPTQLIPQATAPAYKGNIRTEPSGTCTLTNQNLCTVKVIWDVSNLNNPAAITEIKVRETAGSFTQRGNFIKGEADAPWITESGYNFDLYVDDQIYDSIFVKGVSAASSPSPSPSITPSASTSPSPNASPPPSPSPSPSPYASPSPSPSPSLQSKGDGNNDGKVDLIDLSMLYSKWSPAIDITSNFQLDFNDDKRINSFDLLEMNALLKSLGIIKGI